MALKVKGPNWMVGTLDMGTASNGPRAIPAALQVTNAAANTQHVRHMQRQLWLQTPKVNAQSLLESCRIRIMGIASEPGSKPRSAEKQGLAASKQTDLRWLLCVLLS